MRHRACCRPQPGRRRRAAHHRQEEPDPRDRLHPLPAEVRVRSDRRRPNLEMRFSVFGLLVLNFFIIAF